MYDPDNDLRPTDDPNTGIPADLPKNIGQQQDGTKPYLCFLIAHEIIGQLEHDWPGMERFLYRIWASSPEQADKIFMALPEVQKYIQETDDVPNDVCSIYDIDQWDGVLSWIEQDPFMS